MNQSRLPVFTFLAALLLVVALPAQTISFDQLPEARGVITNSVPMFIGCDSHNLVLIQHSGRLKNRLHLVRYNHSLQEQGRALLPSEDGSTCYGGYINGSHIDLLFADMSDTGLCVYHDRRSLATLQTEGAPDVLFRQMGQRGDNFAFANAVSPNGQLLACAFVAQHDVQGTEIKVGLYDHQLEPYWTQTCSTATFSDISVTDSGDIILYSISAGGSCNFTILDGEQELSVQFQLPQGDRVVQRELLRYGDGNILVASAVRHENHTLMPVGSNIDGIDIHCYNIKKKRLTTVHHTFTSQQVARLTNDKENKQLRHFWVQFGQISQQIPDADGAYLVIDQIWRTTLNNVPTVQQRMGMLVMRVDRDGNIQWSTSRRLNLSTRWESRYCLEHRWVPTPTGIMLAWTDHLGNLTLPADSRVKTFTPFKNKASLNVWTLTPLGKEDLSFIELSRQALVGSAHLLDAPGQYVLLLTSGRRQQLTKVTIE